VELLVLRDRQWERDRLGLEAVADPAEQGWPRAPSAPQQGMVAAGQAATTIFKNRKNTVGISPNPTWAVISQEPLTFMVGIGSEGFLSSAG